MKAHNTIWEVQYKNGKGKFGFDSISKIVVEHYKGIFQYPSKQYIKEILLTISKFIMLVLDG